MKTKPGSKKISRKQFMRNAGGAILGGGLISSLGFPALNAAEPKLATKSSPFLSQLKNLDTAKRIAADPVAIPGPITRSHAKTVKIELEAIEMMAEIEDGSSFHYMTFGGQVPSPLIRVREGDTVILTLSSNPRNIMLHNIDLHAVYGTGGGADATYVTPGSSQTIKFKATYPGAFTYHCAVPGMDQHVSSGMFGMILVEPKEGLTKVDHEFYLGQNEIYTQGKTGDKGVLEFDFESMRNENPNYVLLNGQKNALTESGFGPMKVKKGDTARIFFVNGGPNLASSLHPIGNVFSKAWRDGALINAPERFVQTMMVPPGDCAVFEMDFPVPSTIHLIDHAMSRMESKGMMGNIVVEGEPDKSIFDPTYKV